MGICVKYLWFGLRFNARLKALDGANASETAHESSGILNLVLWLFSNIWLVVQNLIYIVDISSWYMYVYIWNVFYFFLYIQEMFRRKAFEYTYIETTCKT